MMRNHPIADVFPVMSDEEYQSLKADIALHGQHETIRTWDGQLIDGKHRLRACEELGIAPKVAEWRGEEADMLRFVFGVNLKRRHLSSGQIAAVTVDFQALLDEATKRAKERQRNHGGTAPGRRKKSLSQKVDEVNSGDGRAAEEVAQEAGTNRQYVYDAQKIKEEAPDLHEEVKRGQKSIPRAKAEIARRKRAKIKQEAVAQVAGAAEEADERFHVEQADCLEWLVAQAADSVQLVFGSPPYENARLYLEDGQNLGIARDTDEWVAWMVEVYRACLRVCTGLVAFVVEGRTKDYQWSASPALLMAALREAGVCLRKPPVYRRVGIPGSGGPDWLRNDYEFIVCATRGGSLPWSDNTAMGQPPIYEPGGDPSHRRTDGSRVNGEVGSAPMGERNNVGPHRARQRAGREYQPPEVANPGNVIECSVGGGNMGDPLCHENEAPFPEYLAEFFIRSFCVPRGIVCDPFCGSGTTGAVAVRHNRRFVGCDLRVSQVELSRQRIARVQPLLPVIGE